MSYTEELTQLIDAVVEGGSDAIDRAYAALPALESPRGRRAPIKSRQRRETFERDRYQCRYCGRPLILSDVLALLTVIDPLRFPWHPNWKFGYIHPAFPPTIPTVDHVVPVVLGGGNDPDNLVTACWPCNHTKLDTDIRPPQIHEVDPSWHGMTDRYRGLWERAGSPDKFRWSVNFYSAPRQT